MTKINNTSDFLTRGQDKRQALIAKINEMLSHEPDANGMYNRLSHIEIRIDREEAALIRAALTQPDVNAELLEALKLPQTMEISESQYRYNEAFNHGINACIKAIANTQSNIDTITGNE